MDNMLLRRKKKKKKIYVDTQVAHRMCESKVARNAPAFDSRVRVNRGANSTAPKNTFELRMFERKRKQENAWR